MQRILFVQKLHLVPPLRTLHWRPLLTRLCLIPRWGILLWRLIIRRRPAQSL